MKVARLCIPCVVLLAFAGCEHVRNVTADALLEKTHHWKEPKVASWTYMGSSDGRDYFHYVDLGIQEIYSIESGRISLPRRFPLTKARKEWLAMPWGPAAPR
jgi:hypothetical protein